MSDTPTVVVRTSGEVSNTEAEHADHTLRQVLVRSAGPAPSATLTLTLVDDAALPRPALAQATVAQGAATLRAQAAAPTVAEAVSLLARRLAHKMGLLRPVGAA